MYLEQPNLGVLNTSALETKHAEVYQRTSPKYLIVGFSSHLNCPHQRVLGKGVLTKPFVDNRYQVQYTDGCLLLLELPVEDMKGDGKRANCIV